MMPGDHLSEGCSPAKRPRISRTSDLQNEISSNRHTQNNTSSISTTPSQSSSCSSGDSWGVPSCSGHQLQEHEAVNLWEDDVVQLKTLFPTVEEEILKSYLEVYDLEECIQVVSTFLAGHEDGLDDCKVLNGFNRFDYLDNSTHPEQTDTGRSLSTSSTNASLSTNSSSKKGKSPAKSPKFDMQSTSSLFSSDTSGSIVSNSQISNGIESNAQKPIKKTVSKTSSGSKKSNSLYEDILARIAAVKSGKPVQETAFNSTDTSTPPSKRKTDSDANSSSSSVESPGKRTLQMDTSSKDRTTEATRNSMTIEGDNDVHQLCDETPLSKSQTETISNTSSAVASSAEAIDACTTQLTSENIAAAIRKATLSISSDTTSASQAPKLLSGNQSSSVPAMSFKNFATAVKQRSISSKSLERSSVNKTLTAASASQSTELPGNQSSSAPAMSFKDFAAAAKQRSISLKSLEKSCVNTNSTASAAVSQSTELSACNQSSSAPASMSFKNFVVAVKQRLSNEKSSEKSCVNTNSTAVSQSTELPADNQCSSTASMSFKDFAVAVKQRMINVKSSEISSVNTTTAAPSINQELPANQTPSTPSINKDLAAPVMQRLIRLKSLGNSSDKTTAHPSVVKNVNGETASKDSNVTEACKNATSMPSPASSPVIAIRELSVNTSTSTASLTNNNIVSTMQKETTFPTASYPNANIESPTTTSRPTFTKDSIAAALRKATCNISSPASAPVIAINWQSLKLPNKNLKESSHDENIEVQKLPAINYVTPAKAISIKVERSELQLENSKETGLPDQSAQLKPQVINCGTGVDVVTNDRSNSPQTKREQNETDLRQSSKKSTPNVIHQMINEENEASTVDITSGESSIHPARNTSTPTLEPVRNEEKKLTHNSKFELSGSLNSSHIPVPTLVLRPIEKQNDSPNIDGTSIKTISKISTPTLEPVRNEKEKESTHNRYSELPSSNSSSNHVPTLILRPIEKQNDSPNIDGTSIKTISNISTPTLEPVRNEKEKESTHNRDSELPSSNSSSNHVPTLILRPIEKQNDSPNIDGTSIKTISNISTPTLEPVRNEKEKESTHNRDSELPSSNSTSNHVPTLILRPIEKQNDSPNIDSVSKASPINTSRNMSPTNSERILKLTEIEKKVESSSKISVLNTKADNSTVVKLTGNIKNCDTEHAEQNCGRNTTSADSTSPQQSSNSSSCSKHSTISQQSFNPAYFKRQSTSPQRSSNSSSCSKHSTNSQQSSNPAYFKRQSTSPQQSSNSSSCTKQSTTSLQPSPNASSCAKQRTTSLQPSPNASSCTKRSTTSLQPSPNASSCAKQRTTSLQPSPNASSCTKRSTTSLQPSPNASSCAKQRTSTHQSSNAPSLREKNRTLAQSKSTSSSAKQSTIGDSPSLVTMVKKEDSKLSDTNESVCPKKDNHDLRNKRLQYFIVDDNHPSSDFLQSINLTPSLASTQSNHQSGSKSESMMSSQSSPQLQHRTKHHHHHQSTCLLNGQSTPQTPCHSSPRSQHQTKHHHHHQSTRPSSGQSTSQTQCQSSPQPKHKQTNQSSHCPNVQSNGLKSPPQTKRQQAQQLNNQLNQPLNNQYHTHVGIDIRYGNNRSHSSMKKCYDRSAARSEIASPYNRNSTAKQSGVSISTKAFSFSQTQGSNKITSTTSTSNDVIGNTTSTRITQATLTTPTSQKLTDTLCLVTRSSSRNANGLNAKSSFTTNQKTMTTQSSVHHTNTIYTPNLHTNTTAAINPLTQVSTATTYTSTYPSTSTLTSTPSAQAVATPITTALSQTPTNLNGKNVFNRGKGKGPIGSSPVSVSSSQMPFRQVQSNAVQILRMAGQNTSSQAAESTVGNQGASTGFGADFNQGILDAVQELESMLKGVMQKNTCISQLFSEQAGTPAPIQHDDQAEKNMLSLQNETEILAKLFPDFDPNYIFHKLEQHMEDQGRVTKVNEELLKKRENRGKGRESGAKSKRWTWKDELGNSHHFTDAESNCIETYFKRNVNKDQVIIQFKGSTRALTFDFKGMKMTNPFLVPERKVDIRRVYGNVAEAPQKSGNQSQNPVHKQRRLNEVFPGTSEFTRVENLLKKTIPPANITKIEKIDNAWLQKKYYMQYDLLKQKNGEAGVNVKELFHGTRRTEPNLIWDSEDGFDMRYSAVGMWGRGCYFAVNALYSHSYAYVYKKHNDKTVYHQMFLAHVLTGDSADLEPNNSIRKPPFNHLTGRDYDSITGITRRHRIYVLYNNAMSYPAYLITYTLQK